jgi:hypothetical protein
MERPSHAKTRSAHDTQNGDDEEETTYHTPHIAVGLRAVTSALQRHDEDPAPV